MFEIGKTYGCMDGGHFRTLRVDHIQHVKGKPDVAIGVANAGDPDEMWDFEEMSEFDHGWLEL